MNQWEFMDKEYIWHPFTQMKGWNENKQLVIDHGEGVKLYDVEGNAYYDGISSLWVNIHGHRRWEIDEAVKKQLALLYCLRADHLTECINSVALKEHMLCTAKTNSLCTKLTSFLSISRSISVCTNFHCSVLVSPSHDTSELTSDLSIYSREHGTLPGLPLPE